MTSLWNNPRGLFTGILTIAFLALFLAIKVSLDHRHWGVEFEVGSVIGSSLSTLKLEPLDFTAEPGELQKDSDLSRFYERQRALMLILSENEIFVEKDDTVSKLSRQKFSVLDLPHLFWVQVLVGLGAFIIAGWVWSLRSRDLAAGVFALSGFSTLLFTFSSAVYTTRELALPQYLFYFLTSINAFGASLFGVAMLGLFLIYPLRISWWKPLFAIQAFFFGVWTFLAIARVLPASMGGNLVTLIEMIGICIALLGQFFRTRGNPTARASLLWLGLSVLVGAGGFITLNALPLVLNSEVTLSQGYAFLFFLVIYAGLAMGITRYRLFDVGTWAFRFLFYSLGAVLLVLLDVALISLLNLERLPALGLSFFAVGLLYLPLRDWVQRNLRNGVRLDPDELISEIIPVALGSTLGERVFQWKKLIQKLLSPLEMRVIPDQGDQVRIEEDGLALYVPPVIDSSALWLRHPWAGKTLFSRESQNLVQHLITLIEQAESSRISYEKGVYEERMRIAQDLHDDVGARLLSGLHKSDANLRSTIQEAIGDIRSIVSGISGQRIRLSHFLADLRHECSGRLDAVGIELHWPVYNGENFDHHLDYRFSKVLTSSVREIISNTIKHSSAKSFHAEIETTEASIKFIFWDDGCGITQEVMEGESVGNGLKILKRRALELNGTLHIRSLLSGTEIILTIPIS